MSNLTVSSMTGPIAQKGAVRQPGAILFMARPTNDYSSGSMPTGVIPMTVQLDTATAFNSGTSAFVAPVVGYYRVTWGGLQLASTVTSLMLNGARTYNGCHLVTATYATVTQTVIVQRNVGDTLQIEGWNGGGYYRDWYEWTVEFIG
jgi:hypothetical protein